MKLAGALLWIVIAVGLIAGVGIAGFVFDYERVRELGPKYEIAVGFITLWSILFVVMTLLRLPSTPAIATAGLFIWIVYRLAVALLTAGWPLVVDLLGEAALAAGFCGYMAGGAGPNAYYRRRLPGS
ncbi:MAG TPA: hypothetical protein VFB13_15345 [Reyranella sp.]|jgi:hypothetical protein|nr:hypothetical protein [Reyranella sp.]